MQAAAMLTLVSNTASYVVMMLSISPSVRYLFRGAGPEGAEGVEGGSAAASGAGVRSVAGRDDGAGGW